MEAILTLLVMVMVFIVARKWVHDKDAPDQDSEKENRQNRNGLGDGVRGR